jgi:hypothetical protein
VEPDAGIATEGGDLAQRIHGARAHRAGGADHHHRQIARRLVLPQRGAQGPGVHAELVVRRDPADRIGAEAREIGGLLDPRMGLCGRVDAQAPRGGIGEPLRADVPRRGRAACREQADDVRHVAAAHEEPAAGGGVADQFRDPAHRLRLDLGGHRSEPPGTDVRIHGGGQQVAEHADWAGEEVM